MPQSRRLSGIFLIIASSFLTIANGGGDSQRYYERELLSGEDVIVQTIGWEASARCIARFDFYEPAMKVSLFDSRDNTLGIMECDDGTDCILAIPSFAECVALSDDEPDGAPVEPEVSCITDLPVYEPMPYDGEEDEYGGDDIKECNDEFTLLLEYEDGGFDEVRYRQLFVHDEWRGYLCIYPY